PAPLPCFLGDYHVRHGGTNRMRRVRCIRLRVSLGVTLLLAERLETPLYFLRGDVLLMRRQRPYVSERVLQRSGPVAVELVRYRLERLGSCRNGLAKPFIHIFDIEQDAHRSAAERLRTTVTHLWELVGQHDG